MDSVEHIQSDNELDSDFEEDADEVEDEEVDQEDKGQISASCCFYCTLSMVESLIYKHYRKDNFIYVKNFCESVKLLLSSIIRRLIQTTEVAHVLCWAKGLAPDSALLGILVAFFLLTNEKCGTI